MNPAITLISEALHTAAHDRANNKPTPAFRIVGQGSKQHWLKQPKAACPLSSEKLSGIVDHQPTELMVRVGSGTPMEELHHELARHQQYLPFDALTPNGRGTVGGALATALAGPRRASLGGMRDFVLGVSLIDGRGRYLEFGGQVIKNVAGYDVSRLLCGSWGQLGLITDVSFRTLPMPRADVTVSFHAPSAENFLHSLHSAINRALPITASHWSREGIAHIRYTGHSSSVVAATPLWQNEIGYRVMGDSAAQSFWRTLTHEPTPNTPGQIWWRLTVPPSTPIYLPLPSLADVSPHRLEWHGALRWYCVSADDPRFSELCAYALSVGGSALVLPFPFAQVDKGEEHGSVWPVVMAMSDIERQLHRQIKRVFDPFALFV